MSRSSSQHRSAPIVAVAVRRVAPATPQPDFVRTGPARVWMERLETRRVLSAVVADIHVIDGGPTPAIECPLDDDQPVEADPADGEIEILIDDGEIVDDGDIADDADDDSDLDDGDGDGDILIDDGEIIDDDEGGFVDLIDGPTDQYVTAVTYIDIVNDAGEIVQSYQQQAIVFGVVCIDVIGYMQFTEAELADYLPKSLALGESVTFTWDDEGRPTIVDELPQTADACAGFETATRIAGDTPQLVSFREMYAGNYADPVDDGSDTEDDGAIIDDGYVDYERGDEPIVDAIGDGTIFTANGIDADGNGASGQTPRVAGTPIPLPSLPTVDERSINDVLVEKKKDDLLGDDAPASLIALIR